MQVTAESLPIELKTVRAMTAAMLVAAENKRWKEVQRIDDARFKLLRLMPAEIFRIHDAAVCRVLHEAVAATRAIGEGAIGEGELRAAEPEYVNRRRHAVAAGCSCASVP